ncbi:hypothetical protein [Marinobacter sp.]|jgi:flagellar motor component MotA|uniref:hypothetical protein n=1 Tax=Marinobacter sp. TaxID=50741 RepID=UPI000C974475|nr:hypothetical protein [Marinobacter sp.]MAK51413.1 hypothetical protein [Marinobacter sp.]|tara:strand:+ start:44 stop:430 length:387 start_codon:yes stop_codon:yes gene_type:complete
MKGAVWNVKYITDIFGRSLKISDMSMNQTNREIRNIMRRIKTQYIHLLGLYQRRFVLMHQEGKINYQRKNAKQKIAKTLGMLNTDNNLDDQRHKHIILTALSFIENGNDDIDLIKAVLQQALEPLEEE